MASKYLKDPRVIKRMDEAYDEVSQAAQGLLDISVAQSSDDLTPIELLALIDLTSIEIQENIHGGGLRVRQQVPVGRYEADFIIEFLGEKIVVECDGHDFHEKTKEQAAHDKKRDRYMQKLGMKVFRFTGSEIWKGVEWCEDVIEEIDEIRKREYQRRYGKPGA